WRIAVGACWLTRSFWRAGFILMHRVAVARRRLIATRVAGTVFVRTGHKVNIAWHRVFLCAHDCRRAQNERNQDPAPSGLAKTTHAYDRINSRPKRQKKTLRKQESGIIMPLWRCSSMARHAQDTPNGR